MFKKIILVAVLASAGALPAFAQGATCAAPAAPAVPDAAKATADQMTAMLAGARTFMAASETYQQCLGNDIAAQKAAATKDKPFDPAIEKADMALVDNNQSLKVKFGADANTALGSFRKLHSCEGKPLASCQ